MLTKCPHCDIEISHGSTACPNCLGSIKYEYMTGPSGGRVKSSKEKWLIALFTWLLCFGLLWWVGESWFGGANFNKAKRRVTRRLCILVRCLVWESTICR